MEFRHEQKCVISVSDKQALARRLQAVARLDPHASGGSYRIRSLYFENPRDKALREKTDGVNRREKFRIRYYDQDTSMIHLEKKSKRNGLGNKSQARLNPAQVREILEGRILWMAESKEPLIRELYIKMRGQGLAPKVIVDYQREPYVFPAGNVRVTLDYNMRMSLCCRDFLKADCLTIPVSQEIVLEVKWDAFLPDIIRDAVALKNGRISAFSKYALCRMYG